MDERNGAVARPPVNVVAALAALLLCQLAGETVALGARLVFPAISFPGPVIGMALFFVVLAVRGGPGASLGATADGILRNLSLLFVPAAVGIVQYGGLLFDFGLAVVAALLVSTVLTLIVTVAVFRLVAGQSSGT